MNRTAGANRPETEQERNSNKATVGIGVQNDANSDDNSDRAILKTITYDVIYE